MTTKPLWITYSWADDAEGDFSYLVEELKTVGVEATYDRVALIPGRRLWEQIGDRILNSPLSGWAYLLTPRSLESQPCREELAYALDRALKEKGKEFPLLGLLHRVPIDEVPPALRVRLCVSLASPDWKEEILAGLESRPPKRAKELKTRYVWRLHKGYGGDSENTAVEVRPRFGGISYWRFAVPSGCSVLAWGSGPSGGGAIGFIRQISLETTTNLGGRQVRLVGCGNQLSPDVSACIVFAGPPPEFVIFGRSHAPLGGIEEQEVRTHSELLSTAGP